jgi:hypothetical protein
MALTEDVGSEVRRILTNNTIDQCILYNQNIKRDIVAAQEELRDVIGQRYRELLEACDRVVGMEDICKSIESSYQTTLEQQQRKAPVTRMAPSTTDDVHHAVRVLQVATLMECEDSLRACRVLTKQNSFGAAAKVYGDFNRLVEEFCEGSSDQADQNVALRRRLVALQVSGSFLIHEIREKMISRLAEKSIGCPTEASTATKAATADGSQVLADIHAGIEVMEKCSPVTALSRLLTLHDDVLDRMQAATKTEDDAVDAVQKVQQLVVALAWYLAQVESHRLQELDGLYSVVVPAAPLHELSQLDPKSNSFSKGGYLHYLRLQLCGHTMSSKRRFSKLHGASSSVTEGWALSPAGTAPPIQVSRSEYRRVEAHALDVIHHVLSKYVASSSALLRVESLLLTPIKHTAANGSVMPAGLWNAATWSEAVKRSIDTAVEGAVGAALQRAQLGLKSALQGQSDVTSVRPSKRPAPSTSREEAVIAAILQRNGYRAATTTATADPREGHHEDVFSSSLKQLNSILDAAGGRQGTASTDGGEASRKAVFTSTVIQLLLQGIESMCGILESAPREAIPASSSSNNNDRGVFRSGLCSVVAKVLCDLKENVQHDAAAAQIIATLESRITAMYTECQQQWLHDISARFTSATSAAYARTLLPPSLLTQRGGRHVANEDAPEEFALSSRFMGARVRSALANVWQTRAVEGTTEVSFPVYFTPGVSRAVFEAHTELLARLEVCGGCLSSSLQRMFGVTLCHALSQCAQSLIKSDPTSTICEEAAFQLYFDLSLILKIITLMAGPASPSMVEVRRSIQQQLDELQESSMDVVNFSVAKDSIHKAVEAAALQNSSLCLGLAVSPYYSVEADAKVLPTGAATFACTLPLEKETDRLPLLPITTPSQVRNITTSLGLPSSPNSTSAAINGGKGGLSGSGTALPTSMSASSLWSATSKLRNLWGQ